MKKRAFTLAEVLITLVIVGVIAALTVPTLMRNTQKKEFTVALRKFYAATNQALLKLTYDEGCSGDLKCVAIFDGDHAKAGSAIAKYYKLTKECGKSTGCWATDTAKNFDGTGGLNHWDSAFYHFLTADGMSVLVISGDDNCATDSSSGVSTRPTKQVCGTMVVDVNGKKGPNIAGRDTFRFWITNGKGPTIYPLGGQYDGSAGWWRSVPYCSVSPGSTEGGYCAARIIEQGWEMNY